VTACQLPAAALLAAALVLPACGSSGGNAGSGTSTESRKGYDADVTFLTGMRPHHQQAVQMSEMVLAADPPAEVAAVAEQVQRAQAPEIAQMAAMLEDLGAAGGAGHGTEHGGGHAMPGSAAGHEGMMSDAEMAALDAATGADAARLFLEGMVRHHQGAITASDAELADGRYGPALDLAQRIKDAQAAEVATLQALLGAL
jgi:uncharacterized protein (DUF305 family)